MSEIINILAETAARLFDEQVTREALEGAETGQWPAGLWATLEENGLTRPLSPEDLGGLGAGWEAAFVIAFAAGQGRAPVPLVETMAAGWLLGRAGIEQPEGPIGLITGAPVPWGRNAGHFVAVAGDEVLLYAAGQARITEDANMAGEARDRVVLDGATVAARGKMGLTAGVPVAMTVGAALRAAQMAGAMERAVVLAVGHAVDRQQFGRPLAKFQAVQQQLAVAAAQAAEARAGAEMACGALDRAGDDLTAAEWDVAAAKVVAGEAAQTVYDTTHQVLGAMGFTYEHELHFATRRLWAWRGEFGADSYWSAEIGRRVLAAGADALWPGLTARQGS